jgi:hypothetical protein
LQIFVEAFQAAMIFQLKPEPGAFTDDANSQLVIVLQLIRPSVEINKRNITNGSVKPEGGGATRSPTATRYLISLLAHL